MKQKPIPYRFILKTMLGCFQVSAIFLKRHINIASLNTSMSEIEDIFALSLLRSSQKTSNENCEANRKAN